jgi:hypothetical protein
VELPSETLVSTVLLQILLILGLRTSSTNTKLVVSVLSDVQALFKNNTIIEARNDPLSLSLFFFLLFASSCFICLGALYASSLNLSFRRFIVFYCLTDCSNRFVLLPKFANCRSTADGPPQVRAPHQSARLVRGPPSV